MQVKNQILVTISVLSIAIGFVEFGLNGKGEFITEKTQTIWGIIFVLLSIFWAIQDSRERHNSKPYDFGFLMYVFWPIAFPYYLFSTRGIEGILYIIGFFTLWSGPWFAGLLAYIYVYPG